MFLGDSQITVKDSNSNDVNCFEDGKTVILSCKIDPLTAVVIWTKDSSTQATCLNTGDTCVPSARDDARYSFTSDYLNGEYYFTITNIDSNVDKGTYICEHSSDLPSRIINPCTVQSA